MILFRLSKSSYAKDLSGKGAEKSGGRWNSKGTAMIYTCSSRALCTTEIAVHTPLGNIPTDYVLVTLVIADKIKILTLDDYQLPINWKTFPHAHSTQELGDQFVADNKYLIYKVPSAVVQGEFNYLINPLHKEIRQVKIQAVELFSFDERLFRK